jgi:hypothetical protein
MCSNNLLQILGAASASFGDAGTNRRTEMLLATTTVEDFDRFTSVFSTKGAEKRKQHGSKGAHVFRDPRPDRPAVADGLCSGECRDPRGRRHQRVHIFDKTGARTRSAATVWAVERHLVQSA